MSLREHAVLSLDLIDAPALDARIDRDPEKLEELARDILRRGLIEPIKVVRVGDRFEVVDGFRRYLAAKSAGLAGLECLIYPSKELALEGVKYAANAFREDMSPADEAIYFHQLLTTECDNDIEKLCALVGKKLNYVDGRLSLLGGDELVFDALRAKQITIGVAHEINRVEDAEYRRYFLKHAIKEGATITVVTGWVQQWRSAIADHAHSHEPVEASASSTAAPTHDPFRCYVCKRSDPRRVPEVIYVHGSCREAILDVLLNRDAGEPEPHAALIDLPRG